MKALRRILCALAAVGMLSGSEGQAAVITTTDLVAVAGGPGTFTFSVGGWTGGGSVTGSFTGVDVDFNGQLSLFNGEVSDFSAAYSGGTVVGPVAFGFADLFGLVYDLDGGPLGDGLILDLEGIGAADVSTSFVIGPGPIGPCGVGEVCGVIEGPAVPEPHVLPLLMTGLGVLMGLRRRRA